jgi:uncharacterized FlaG/YvyC family protein
MEINPINAAGHNAPAVSESTTVPANIMDRQIVSAVQSLNKSELLGQDRELAYRRDQKTGRVVIQILQRQTGEVIDQIPPETLLELRASFEQLRKVPVE